MTTKKRYTLAIFLLLSSSLFAQTTRNRCNSTSYRAAQIAENPALAAAYENARLTAAAYANTPQAALRSVITIPVVVHIVYKTAAENISDVQVATQLAALNEDFAGMNADSVRIPSVFKPRFAHPNIQFCLAKRTPAGIATTGIIRKTTTRASFTDDDAVKKANTGGDNAWDASKYLNLWVCNLGTDLLGYAQYPGGLAATDGVVIHYKFFGRGGSAEAPYNQGRTGTHEIGHWFGLDHIDGDATCGNDNIADTPTQNTLNYDCPTFPQITCNNGPNGDMFMNYMDYVDDACMQMFTIGQDAVIEATINTTRQSLQNSLGCLLPTATEQEAFASLNATIQPNPTNAVTTILLQATRAEILQINLYDAVGRLSFSQLTQTTEGRNEIRLDLAHLPSGSYALSMQTPTQFGSQKLVIYK